MFEINKIGRYSLFCLVKLKRGDISAVLTNFEGGEENVNDMQIYLDRKSYACLRRNNTVSFHMNGSFYTLSYNKRKSLCSLSRYDDDGKKYFVGIFEYPICLEYQEELKLKERKKEI